jgi:hypothetical protein
MDGKEERIKEFKERGFKFPKISAKKWMEIYPFISPPTPKLCRSCNTLRKGSIPFITKKIVGLMTNLCPCGFYVSTFTYRNKKDCKWIGNWFRKFDSID